MPLFVSALIGALLQVAGTLAGRVLLSIGFGFVTFTGLDASLTWFKVQLVSAVGELGSQALSVLSAASVGTSVSIVVSAVAARMLLDGVTGGALKRMVLK